MSLTGIKMGRIPKAVKEQALNKANSINEVINEEIFSNQNESDYEMTRDENDCTVLNEKMSVKIKSITEQTINNEFETNENDELFNVIKQMSSTKPNNNKLYNYHHVYDINHTDDCLAQFLDSIDMYIKSPDSNSSQQNSPYSPSYFNNHSFDATSSPNCSDIFHRDHPIKASSIEIKSNFLDIYMQMTHENLEPSYKIICSLLNDKIYQIFNENMEKINLDLKNTIHMLESEDQSQFNNASLDEIWSGLIGFVPCMVKLIIVFVKEMPGLNELSPKDFTTIINNRMFDSFILIHSCFFINGESYLRLNNNAHYSRYWMNKVKGKKKTDAVFDFVEQLNALQMTTRERSLLLPLIITMHDESIEDLSTLHVLNEYYTRAILYEFDLTKRDNSFIIELSKVKFLFEEFSLFFFVNIKLFFLFKIISKLKQCKTIGVKNFQA